MIHLKFLKHKFLLWFTFGSLTILALYYLQLLLVAYRIYSIHGTTHSNELPLLQSNEKINEAYLSRRSNVQSTWTCTGNMNYESDWKTRTCAFKNICYNKKKKVFQFYRKPGNIKTPILFEPKLGHIYDFHINDHGFVALFAHATSQNSWGPTIVEEWLPLADKVPYLEHVHVLFSHWWSPYNPGHVIWEDIAPTYLAMIRLNEYDRNAVLLEYRRLPKQKNPFYPMFHNIIPAFAAKFDSLHHYMNNFSSHVVCFRTIVAGGGIPVFSLEYEPYINGKERLLYDFRTAILRYHGVNVSHLPSRHRIILVNKTQSKRASLRAIKNLAEVEHFIHSTYPKIQLDVIVWNKYTFTQQMHELYKTTILITPCGGISTIIPFLPEGTHAIVTDFYVNERAYSKIARYAVGESAAMDASFLNYFPHVRKLYYQVRSDKDYVFDFPTGINSRTEASIIINTTRLQELIDTALQESSLVQ
ncbi:unnamed protein product [Rotaria sp. Silwood2]|nr:unnamed protein product [Rotaria sp. Silwood2]